MTTKASAIQKERGTPRPPADGVSRLARACFFGSAIKVPLPIRPLCAHVEAHNFGGCGKPPKLRRGKAAPVCRNGGTSCGRLPMLERARRGIGSLMPRRGIGGRGRRGLRPFSGATMADRVVGRRGRGLSSGLTVGQRFSWRAQRGANLFRAGPAWGKGFPFFFVRCNMASSMFFETLKNFFFSEPF